MTKSKDQGRGYELKIDLKGTEPLCPECEEAKILKLIFDKSATKWVMQVFKDIKPICFSCKKKLTPNNIGGIRQGTGMVCNKLPCLIEFAKECKKDQVYV